MRKISEIFDKLFPSLDTIAKTFLPSLEIEKWRSQAKVSEKNITY